MTIVIVIQFLAHAWLLKCMGSGEDRVSFQSCVTTMSGRSVSVYISLEVNESTRSGVAEDQ